MYVMIPKAYPLSLMGVCMCVDRLFATLQAPQRDKGRSLILDVLHMSCREILTWGHFHTWNFH